MNVKYLQFRDKKETESNILSNNLNLLFFFQTVEYNNNSNVHNTILVSILKRIYSIFFSLLN